jgi:hypothetical protein
MNLIGGAPTRSHMQTFQFVGDAPEIYFKYYMTSTTASSINKYRFCPVRPGQEPNTVRVSARILRGSSHRTTREIQRYGPVEIRIRPDRNQDTTRPEIVFCNV